MLKILEKFIRNHLKRKIRIRKKSFRIQNTVRKKAVIYLWRRCEPEMRGKAGRSHHVAFSGAEEARQLYGINSQLLNHLKKILTFCVLLYVCGVTLWLACQTAVI